jgi:murein endopeptidase
MATASALGSTVTMFVALTAVGIASSPSAQSDGARRASSGAVLQAALGPDTVAEARKRVKWRKSRALGQPTGGSLVNATKLPAEGRHFVTWDYNRHRSPSEMDHRYGTGHLIRVVLTVAAEFARAYPGAARLVIGDLSRPRGGGWGSGAHASHQNGLDVDIYYPRRDKRERAPLSVSQIDHKLAQDLVNRFVRAGAQYVFIGPNTSLTGRRGVVMDWPNHDNHLHVRLPAG